MQIPNNPVFYDFEASSLFDGFPIEVGWAWVADSAIHAGSLLIRPTSSWNADFHWDDGAEALHRISKDQLRAEGRSPYQVARHMNAVLAGRALFSDGSADEKWMADLFDAAGLDKTFEIRRMSSETLIGRLAQANAIGEAQLGAIAEQARIQAPQAHRAQADAIHWGWIWREIQRVARAELPKIGPV